MEIKKIENVFTKKNNSWWTERLSKLRRSRNKVARKIDGLKKQLTSALKTRNSLKFLIIKRKLGKYFDTSRILKKVYNSIIKINKKIDLKEKRLKLINGYLGDKNYFRKEITERRGGRVEVDIDLEKLRHSYEENFNCISQSDESIKLENSMRVVVDKYKKFIGSKTIRTRVRVCEITKILKSLKNKKKGGHNNCCNEMFKYSTTTSLPHIIANLFQNIIRGGYFPDNLNIGLISTKN